MAAGLALFTTGAWWWGSNRPAATPGRPAAERAPEPKQDARPAPLPRPLPQSKAQPSAGPAREERDARVAAIKRDYDEMTARFAAEFSAAGENFPGGLNAYLRQLALLEREKWRDLAAVLPPDELEQLQLVDTHAGKLVQQWLGDTAASAEQRRAVFALQRDFDDRFALTFDLTPPALLARERARQETQARIRVALGDELFASWLRVEGADFGNFANYTSQLGLPADAALNLWRVKSDFTIQRLENAARTDYSVEQLRAAQAALAQETLARVIGILGPGPTQAAGSEVLGWLPRP